MNTRSQGQPSGTWTLALFGLVALLLGIGGWLFDRSQERADLAARYKELTAIAQLKVDQIASWRAERLAGVRVLADWPELGPTVARWLGSPGDASLKAAARRYLQVARTDIGYADVLVAAKDGEVLLSAVDAPVTCGDQLVRAVRESVRSGQPVLTDFYRCPASPSPHIEAVGALRNAGGEIVAALVTRSDPQRNLYPLLRAWPTWTRSGESLLVRREGDGVLFLTELRHRNGSALQLRLRADQVDRPAVQAAMGRVGRVDGVDYRGVPVLADVRPVPDSPWFMIAKVDLDEALADSHGRTRFTVAIVALSVMLAAAVLGLVSRRRQRNFYRSLYESELRFRTLVEHAGEGVVVQTKGRFAYLNPAALRLFAADSPDQLLNQPVLDRFDRESRPPVSERMRVINEERRGVGLLEETILRLDGVPVAVEVSAAPIVYEGERGAVVFFREIQERVAARRALQESEEYYRTLFEQSPFPMWVFDADSLRILAVNATACRHYGYTKEEFGRLTVRDLRPADGLEQFDQIMRQLDSDLALRIDVTRHRKSDGSVIDVEVASQQVRFQDHHARIVVVSDVTERRRLEHQLQQAQKMEVVGQLAGGIAHDFNNLLTVINNAAEMALDDMPAADPAREYLRAIAEAGDRAAALTAQLLAFSRKQVRQPEVLDLNDIVRAIEPMLRRLLGEDIDLVTTPAHDLPTVLADRGQVEQVLVNLAVNSRDAMPGGGKLTLETACVTFDAAYAAAHPGVVPGRYAGVLVSDNGCGMDALTRARLFEPFFTTKAPGKGTGLGLSTVYGIVKQNGGNIDVYSEPGRGTTFKVYLPEAAGVPVVPVADAATRRASTGGSETLLLVEDEPQVRALAQRILQQAGYRVLAAESASAALGIVASTPGTIDALITDVVMPEMSGRQLADRLAVLRPNTRVLYMSGYTANAIVHHGVLDPGIAFLGKPFSAADLKQRVRDLLDGAPSS